MRSGAPSMLEKMIRDRGADGSVIVDDRMTLLDLEKKLAGREIEGLDGLLFHDEREPLSMLMVSMTAWTNAISHCTSSKWRTDYD